MTTTESMSRASEPVSTAFINRAIDFLTDEYLPKIRKVTPRGAESQVAAIRMAYLNAEPSEPQIRTATST